MERGNSKHGPRVDDQMSREANEQLRHTAGSRAEEWRTPEPAGEDQPEATTAPAGDRRSGAPQGMTSEEVEQRSRLGRFITLAALPGDRLTLRANAEENEAPSDILAELDRLPDDVEYRTINEVWAALGHNTETQRW
ncbi:DUF2795 domain-containing protein [Plantactinospora sp. KBS50]|uniref:DUF2795 domain-containing protein n=1 Tax=Plantactinospora sp. KBS50 TaxID=2024580 RepID=UPI000BAB1098|nr:DUF2795 domain-containing protein [Plantactinospora sp. KBS50]ASW54573.1 hypothetical protein CIK06_10815 [Plantactinospora sp. KBS50]